MKTLYSILLCGLFYAATMTANAQTWNCGYPNAADVKATLDANGVMTISGTGAMADYIGSARAPWSSLHDQIKEVIIEQGVITIGVNAFYYCGNLTFVSIPASITTIGENAFYGCTGLWGPMISAVIP